MTNAHREGQQSDAEATRAAIEPNAELSGSASNQDSALTWLPGMEILPGYFIRGLLGTGGFGQVFLVDRLITKRKYEFAVKVLSPHINQSQEQNRAFLRELRTWIELPRHPNIVTCFFHRWIKDRLAIFADYMDGDSLHAWISDNRLTDLKMMLNIAIQIASGILAAHDNGVVHQDIKPSNIMMTCDGSARITDFGLSGSVANLFNDQTDTTRGSAGLISSKGFTLPFCSPEQAQGSRINRQTDIWSFGLTMLQMFTGCITWRFGPMAAIALNQYLEHPPPLSLPPMPNELADLLRWCFNESILKRPNNMRDVLDRLVRIYESETGLKSSVCETLKTSVNIPSSEVFRSLENGILWSDPVELLGPVILEVTKGSRSLSTNPVQARSRRAQALMDLEVYDEAIQLLQEVHESKSKYSFFLALALMNKGSILMLTDDLDGADSFLSKAELILKDIGSEPPAIRKRVTVMLWRGLLAMDHQKLDKAESIFGGLLELHRTSANCFLSSGDRNYSFASALSNLGLVFFAKNDYVKALELFNSALDYALRSSIDLPSDPRPAELQASLYMNSGLIHRQNGELDNAESLIRKSLEIHQNAHSQTISWDLRKSLAKTRMNLAVILSMKGFHDESIKILDEVIEQFEMLAAPNIPSEFSRLRLGAIYNKAIALQQLGFRNEALNLLRSISDTLEEFIYRNGFDSLLFRLAGVMSQIGHMLIDDKRYQDALPFLYRAIDSWDELLMKQPNPHFEQSRTDAQEMKSYCLNNLKETDSGTV